MANRATRPRELTPGAAAEEAINRCLRIIRRGDQQARIWRHRALRLAIIIDLADTSPPA